MDPADFHVFSVRTLAQGRPVDYRVAIGRAYYGAFNVAAQLLRNAHCKISENSGAHGEVARLLKEVGSDESVQDAGDWIDHSKSLRNKADYEMNNALPEGARTAEVYVQEAGEHIVALRAVFSGSKRASVLVDLRAYEEKMKPGYKPPK